MIRISDIKMPLDYTDKQILQHAARILCVPSASIKAVTILRRSVDARKKNDVHFRLTVLVSIANEEHILTRCRHPKVSAYAPQIYTVPSVTQSVQKRPVVIGSGPAGLFAALVLAMAGVPPLVLERGQDVDTRKADVDFFRKTGILNTSSNVQFGEGGAGTFSDGKLNTGVKDIRCRFVLEEFVKSGAPSDILWQAKPHIGTDKLLATVKGLRNRIIALGGEVRFGCYVRDFCVKDNRLTGVIVDTPDSTEEISTDCVILATGHSARDTMQTLHNCGVYMEQKPFAVGVRIEHLRAHIDTAQYGTAAGHLALGAADYKLVQHLPNGRSVYSFCMCPGGVVIAAASEDGGLAVNGMSEYARDAVNSNSALLVDVQPIDFRSEHPLAGVAFQRKIEHAAFVLGGKQYTAPIQRVGDFLRNRASTEYGEVIPSYTPAVLPCDLSECLPAFVTESLKTALPLFGRQLQGFDHADAVMTGVESRSSSPVRIVRDQSGQSSLRGLYPCGEGAGYAGGITSAAVDGIRCAEWVLKTLQI